MTGQFRLMFIQSFRLIVNVTPKLPSMNINIRHSSLVIRHSNSLYGNFLRQTHGIESYGELLRC